MVHFLQFLINTIKKTFLPADNGRQKLTAATTSHQAITKGKAYAFNILNMGSSPG